MLWLRGSGRPYAGNTAMASIWLRRAYTPAGRNDGQRILVDRLWPRGVSKEELKIDCWAKDLAPSDELRKWFDHQADKWCEFQQRHHQELDQQSDAVDELCQRLHKGRITLVYAARDEQYNNAVSLKNYLLAKHNK